MPMIAVSRGLLSAASMLSLVVAIPALAADIEAKSRVDSVVVYPDAASVTRAVEVDLPAGSSTMILRGLPMGLDPSSLRIDGAADGKLSIGAVETRVGPTVEPQRDNALEAKLKSLRSEREGWQATLDALEAKKGMMIRFSQSGQEKLSPDSKPLDISQWSAAWDAVGQGLAKIGDDLRAARARAAELDDDIKALEQARQRPKTNAIASREVSVSIDADAATKGKLTLTYRVAGAAWQPAYDAKLDTASGAKAALELVRRATITQRTGEDWTNVALSVSTTRARRGAQAPDVFTQRLAFYEPPSPMAAGGLARGAPMAKSAAAPSAEAFRDAPAPPPAAQPRQRAEEQQATLDAGSYQASFQIPGRVDIPSDGSSKGFRISTTKFTPDLVIKTSPSLDETAYLQARIVNAEDAPLLPGQVNIQRDGPFVGVSRIGLVAPGDSAEMGFGADDRVKVSRVPIKRKENEPSWIGSTKTEQREFRTSVKNLHPFAVKVNVVDQIPISENNAIVIEQASNTTAPTEKIVNDRRGVMGWTFDLAPNDTKNITLAYRMKWPADRDVVFETVPNGPSPLVR
jgi:uncharacterized protein (TIGR02231 family)